MSGPGSDEEFTDIYELVDALESVIQSSDPDKREALARTIDTYQQDCPDEFDFAISGQAPMMLYQLVMAIDVACRPESASKPRAPIRLVPRKPH